LFPTNQLVRAGDLVELRARVNGLTFQGKHNVNERHTNLSANDFEVVILEKSFGLPDPAEIALTALKDAGDNAIFDDTRQTGGERYQGESVQIQRVRLGDAAAWGTDSDLVLDDTAGRTLPVYLGLNSNFDTETAPWGYFDVTGVLDQKSPTHTDGYRLLAMSAHDFLHIEGDADRDWDADNSDLGTATGNFTGPGAYGKTWSEGNFDGDGDVDNTDLGEAFGNFTGPVLPPTEMVRATDLLAEPPASARNAADRADLLYDPASGEVFLDQTQAAGGVITNFVLADDQGGLQTGVVAWPYAGALQTDLPYEISQTDPLSEGLPEDVWNLGAIFPGGMDQVQLEAFLEQATYVGQLGSGVATFDVIAVPEPASLSLLGIALASLSVVLNSRRRSRERH
jgi:hypothetical protein